MINIEEEIKKNKSDAKRLEEQLLDEKIKKIVETKAFQESDWTVISLKPKIELWSLSFNSRKLYDIFYKITFSDNELFNFDNFTLRFFYADITLTFDSYIKAIEFIKKYKLSINLDRIQKEQKDIETFINAISKGE